MKLTAGKAIEYLKHAPQAVAAWVCGMSPRSFRDRHAPRNPDGSYDIRAVVQSLIKAQDEADIEAAEGISSPALERWRLARAKDAEITLAERQRQIVSVELFQRMTAAAFVPLRRFAEEQIREHGNGTADAWAEAVEEFEREVEGVIGQSVNVDGANPTEAAVGPAETATPDAAD
jgi:hypothetical protein